MGWKKEVGESRGSKLEPNLIRDLEETEASDWLRQRSTTQINLMNSHSGCAIINTFTGITVIIIICRTINGFQLHRKIAETNSSSHFENTSNLSKARETRDNLGSSC